MSGPTFAETLRRYRFRARLSQSRLAGLAGFDHSFISRLESGTRTPSRNTVIFLGIKLGLNPVESDSLLAAAGFMPGDPENLLASEPVIGRAFTVLQDATLSDEAKEDLRNSIALLIRQAQRATGGSLPL